MLKGLKGGFSTRGFVSVGEKELVIADLGVGGEEFDEEPGLLRGPGAGSAVVGVEKEHFEDFGGGLLDNLTDGFYAGGGIH